MKTLLLVLFLFSAQSLSAQHKLNRLVQERETLHQEWQASEEKKSGIFGNRTKKDMVETNQWMERIIQKDNQIIAELELLKNIETTEISYQKDDYKFIAQKQEQDIGKLKRVILEKEEEVEGKVAEKRTYEWMTLIFFVSTLILGRLYYKKVRPSAQFAVEESDN
ncbi:Clp protease ClpB [Pararhodonellum marinum]|uniref:Clp protease ClpB n=1 Tax=Pararhodonellum marinum TaxID=2755358 RepID=UPI00188ED94A|nr:Clp protease ClpB [Pararhodonellum marinum]